MGQAQTVDSSKHLGEERIGKLLWKYSLPSIIGMVVTAINSIVDRIFVGRGVGMLAISATTVSFPIIIMMLAFGVLIGVGGAVTLSIKLGRNEREEAGRILGNAMSLTLTVSILFTIAGLVFLEPLLKIFGASQVVLPYAKQFVFIILVGSIFQMICVVFNGLIRANGSPTLSMIIMISGAVINSLLNPLFIFGFHFGIRGSAAATVISQIIGSVWMIAYFARKKSNLKFRLENFIPDAGIIKPMLSIGVSAFTFQIISSIIAVIFNKSLGIYGGDTAIAAMGIISTISMLIMLPISGISMGAQPILGYNFGAGFLDRVKQTFKLAAIAATCISATGFILVELFPGRILSIFSNHNQALLAVGVPGMQLYFMMLFLNGFQHIGTGYFQSTGKAKISFILSLTKPVCFQMPMLFLMPQFFKLGGIWSTGFLSDFLAALLVAILLFPKLAKSEPAKEKLFHLDAKTQNDCME